jgi:hypothetical protein
MTTKPISRSSGAELQNWTRNYSVEEKLATGESIRVRAARPDDRERLLDHLEHLSPASFAFSILRDQGEFQRTARSVG